MRVKEKSNGLDGKWEVIGAGRIRQRDRADICAGSGVGLTCLASALSRRACNV